MLIGLTTQDILTRYGQPLSTRIEKDNLLSWGMGGKTNHRVANVSFDLTTKRCVFAKFWFSKGPRLTAVLPSSLVNVEPLVFVSGFPGANPNGKTLMYFLQHEGKWVSVSIGEGYGKAYSAIVPRQTASERFNQDSGMNDTVNIYDYNAWRGWGSDFTISQAVYLEDDGLLTFWNSGNRGLYQVVNKSSGSRSWLAYESIPHSLRWHGVYGSTDGPDGMMLRVQAAGTTRRAIDEPFNITGSPSGGRTILIRH